MPQPSFPAPPKPILKHGTPGSGGETASQAALVPVSTKRVLFCLPSSEDGGVLAFFQPGRSEALSPALLPAFREHAKTAATEPRSEQAWWKNGRVPACDWPSPSMYAEAEDAWAASPCPGAGRSA